jgi:uncharacterized DUF497 family protein
MRFEWDPEKNRENQRKHRMSFDDATEAFQDPFPIRDYDDRDYDEDRWVLIARMRGIVVYVVYTDRGHARRLISARKATPDEEARYWARYPWS